MNAQEQLPRKSRTKKPKRSVSSTSTRDRTNTKRNKRRNRQREREKNRRVVRAPCFAIGRKGEGGKAAPPPRHPPRDLLASGGQKRIGRAYFIDTLLPGNARPSRSRESMHDFSSIHEPVAAAPNAEGGGGHRGSNTSTLASATSGRAAALWCSPRALVKQQQPRSKRHAHGISTPRSGFAKQRGQLLRGP